jgi:hypothetical protein
MHLLQTKICVVLNAAGRGFNLQSFSAAANLIRWESVVPVQSLCLVYNLIYIYIGFINARKTPVHLPLRYLKLLKIR